MKGIYAATLGGDRDLLQELAKDARELHREYTLAPKESDADAFYLVGCLAGAVTGEYSHAEVDALREINDGKSGEHALYGGAIIKFVTGLERDDETTIADGIDMMLEYHLAQQNTDGVIDFGMAPEVTALLILAHWRAYDIDIDSEYVPIDLLIASVKEL